MFLVIGARGRIEETIWKPGKQKLGGCLRDGIAGRATTPVGAASPGAQGTAHPTWLPLFPACNGLPTPTCELLLPARSHPTYLYAIAALDGPARWMTSKRLKPISRHHFSKSAAE